MRDTPKSAPLQTHGPYDVLGNVCDPFFHRPCSISVASFNFMRSSWMWLMHVECCESLDGTLALDVGTSYKTLQLFSIFRNFENIFQLL